MKSYKKEIIRIAQITTIALALTLGANVLFAWTGPTATPPSNNVSAPVNVGATAQDKAGSLTIDQNMLIQDTSGAANGLIVSNGKVGIGPGATSPDGELTVDASTAAFISFRDLGASGLVLASDDTPGYLGTYLLLTPVSSASAFSRIQSYAGASTPKNLSINSGGGDVGIGTDNPTTELYVNGGGASSIDMYVNGRIMTGDGNQDGGIWLNSAQTSFLGSESNPTVGIYTGASWVLSVTQAHNVGINRVAPAYPLDVNGTVNATQYCISGANCITAWPSGGSGTITGVVAGTGLSGGGLSGTVTLNNTGVTSLSCAGTVACSGSTGAVTITGSGGGGSGTVTSVGTGSNLTGGPITTSGTISVVASPTFSTLTTTSGANGSITSSGGVTAAGFYYSSDRSLKTNIQNLDPQTALNDILALQGVSFNWKSTGQAQVGLIAQDVQKVFPQLVATDPKTGLESVEYGNLVAPLIEAVKEQQTEIQQLQAEVKSLQATK